MELLSLNQIIRDKISSVESAAKDRFRGAIRPIYGATESRETPYQIGTCILFKNGPKKFLLTAAHVIDHNRDSSLYVGGENLVMIESNFITTRSDTGKRDDDIYDFALTEVTEDFASKLGNVYFISEGDIDISAKKTEGHLYVCLGFPNSKNKRINYITNSVRSCLASYSSTAVSESKILKKLAITGRDHILIDRKKSSKNDNGEKTNSFSPIGMSGGAVFDGGNLSDPKYVASENEPTPKLVGLLIEHRKEHQVIISTRIGFILDKCFPPEV